MSGQVLFMLPWELHHAGGVNTVVRNLIVQARRDGEKPTLLINRWSHSILKEATENGLPTARYRIRSPFISNRKVFGFMAWLITLPSSLLLLARFLRSHEINAINIHYPGLDALQFVCLRTARLFRGRLVLSFHGADVDNITGNWGVQRFLWMLLMRKSDLLVTCSGALATRLKHHLPAHQHHKLVVIHNGTDIGLLQKNSKDNPAPEDFSKTTFLLNIATYEPKKGQEVLLQAFSTLHRNFDNLKLVIIGRSTDYGIHLEAEAKRLGISKHVSFIRDISWEQVSGFLKCATIFVLPSYKEPFGIVLLEAGAFSLPIVASRVGGIPEFIDDGQNGLLVPAGDVTALADAIQALLRDPETAQRLGAALNNTVTKRFTWEHCWERYRQCFEPTTSHH